MLSSLAYASVIPTQTLNNDISLDNKTFVIDNYIAEFLGNGSTNYSTSKMKNRKLLQDLEYYYVDVSPMITFTPDGYIFRPYPMTTLSERVFIMRVSGLGHPLSNEFKMKVRVEAPNGGVLEGYIYTQAV